MCIRDSNDPEDWKEIIGTKSHKEELARKFKDNDDPMKIAIVVDMWLTGFDVPSLATMYVYKPMHGYNLMPVSYTHLVQRVRFTMRAALSNSTLTKIRWP